MAKITHTYKTMCKVVREKVKKKHLINENHSTLTVGGIYNNRNRMSRQNSSQIKEKYIKQNKPNK